MDHEQNKGRHDLSVLSPVHQNQNGPSYIYLYKKNTSEPGHDYQNDTSQESMNSYDFNDANNNSHSVMLVLSDQDSTSSDSTDTNATHDQHSESPRIAKTVKNGKLEFSSPIVPTMNNVDEIFQLFSQKIAKYCQVLSDLTNCEVFYKAQLPANSKPSNGAIKSTSKKKTRQSKTLYWGTHKMLFEYSHNDGIRYDKLGGDSLIKIHQRSIISNVHDLIEEILNGPSGNFQQQLQTEAQSPTTSNSSLVTTTTTTTTVKKKTNKKSKSLDREENDLKQADTSQELANNSVSGPTSSKGEIKFKDCCIYLNRLNESVFDSYLNKFENTHLNNNDNDNTSTSIDALTNLPSDEELYSDEFTLNSSALVNNNEDISMGSDEEERVMLEKNLTLSDTDVEEDEYYTCELCLNTQYKHLPQFKLHHLREHNPEYRPVNNNQCSKCKQDSFETNIDLIKHMLQCYYPDIYTCRTCSNTYDNYKDYLFHTKYVHSSLVYICSYCNRKYKTIKEVLQHNELMHSKKCNYCEICFESLKTRQDLYEHYKLFHLIDQPFERIDSSSLVSSIKIIDSKRTTRLSSTSEHNEEFNALEAVLLDNSSINANNKIGDSILNLDNITLDLYCTKDNHSNELETNANDKTEPVKSKISTTSSLTPATETIITESKNSDKRSIIGGRGVGVSKILKLHKNDLIRGLIDRKHQCKWCSLRFFTKSQLKAHELTHSNTSLNCPVCDKEFHHKDRLSGHMKCHMEPSLECKVCGKKFKRLCNLYNHELVHGLTEHAFMLCQFCGRGFRSRRDYQNHVIANHREMIMKCENDNGDESFSLQDETDNETIGNGCRSKKKRSAAAKRKYVNKNSKSETSAKRSKSCKVKVVKKGTFHATIAAPQSQPAAPTTTTVMLSDDTPDPRLIDIESDTAADSNTTATHYFTRTDIIQLSKDDLRMYHEEENESEEYDENEEDNVKYKIRNRLRSSLNLETNEDAVINVDDDEVDDYGEESDSDNHAVNFLNENLNCGLDAGSSGNNKSGQTTTTVFRLVSLNENI